MLLPYLTITERCVRCDNCTLVCPENAITVLNDDYSIDTWSCTLCNLCVDICPVDCIKMNGNQD